MEKKNYNQIAGQKVSRIEALSDGLFAIAMTLLILGVAVPSSKNVSSEGEVFELLLALAPKFLPYLLGFMTLGIFWVGHSTQFKFIDKTDRHLTWVSIFFWMFISGLPFSTGVLSEFIRFKMAVGLYWFNIFLCGSTLYINWTYAERHDLLNEKLDTKTIGKAMRFRIVTSQILYACAALLCFINVYLSVGLLILIQLNYAFAFFYKPETPASKT